MSKKRTFLFLLLYLAIRLFSYFFPPDTPLHAALPINSIVAGFILVLIAYLLIARSAWGWYIIALEIILGGAGGLLALGGVVLRTWLLTISILIFFGYKIKDDQVKNFLQANKIGCLILSFLYLAVLVSGLRGYFSGHAPKLIFADAIPYLFLLYYFPLKELLQRDFSSAKVRGLSLPSFAKEGTGGEVSASFRKLALNAVYAAIIGNFLFIAFTFISFSTGIFELQDPYYHWYRDVALGKITALSFNFYRLLLNEHLLLVPILLYFIAKLIRTQNLKSKITLPLIAYCLLLIAYSINLTRIYLVALVIGLIALYSKQFWRRWLAVSLATIIFGFASFTAIHLAASRGQSLGWELFGLRLQSIAAPQIEESSLSRLLLLPKIWEKIKAHPMLGTGLGDTVTVFSPIFKQEITTPHFDWGYLEILAEMGILGALTWLILIAFVWFLLLRRGSPGGVAEATTPRRRWMSASFTALLVINLTSPALFHVLGVSWLVYLLASLNSRDCQPPPA